MSSHSADTKCRSTSAPQCNIVLRGNWQTVSYQGVHLQNTCYSADKKGQKHVLHTSQNSYSDNRHCTANNYYLFFSVHCEAPTNEVFSTVLQLYFLDMLTFFGGVESYAFVLSCARHLLLFWFIAMSNHCEICQMSSLMFHVPKYRFLK